MNEDVIDFIKTLGVGCRHPKDEFFREGNEINKIHKIFGVHEVDDEEYYHKSYSEFSCHVPGCTVSCETVYEYEQHYNSSHRFSCSQCNKYLPTAHLLELHVTETHDAYFKALSEKKPMFQCYLQDCKNVFQTPQLRREHCITNHKFPSNFRFDDAKKKKQQHKHPKKSNTEKNKKSTGDLEMPESSCADDMKMEISSETNVFKSKAKSKRNTGSGHMRQKLDLDCFVKDLKESLPS